MVQTVAVKSADAAAAAAARLEGPVVLKGTAPDLLHKTEHALVALDVDGEAAARAAYETLAQRLGDLGAKDGEILLQPMVGTGIELILGARREGGFGTAVVVGVGGTLVEVIKQASLRIAPVEFATACEMLGETPAGTLLRGTRGRGPFDFDAAAAAIVAFSAFAAGAGEAVRAIEINPLIVLERGDGAVGVDAVFEP